MTECMTGCQLSRGQLAIRRSCRPAVGGHLFPVPSPTPVTQLESADAADTADTDIADRSRHRMDPDGRPARPPQHPGIQGGAA